jgi:hypothetical protein
MKKYEEECNLIKKQVFELILPKLKKVSLLHSKVDLVYDKLSHSKFHVELPIRIGLKVGFRKRIEVVTFIFRVYYSIGKIETIDLKISVLDPILFVLIKNLENDLKNNLNLKNIEIEINSFYF